MQYIPQMKLEQMTATTQMHSTTTETHRKHIKGLATPYLGMFSETFICCVHTHTQTERRTSSHTHMCTVSISQAHPILTYEVDLISLLPNTRR